MADHHQTTSPITSDSPKEEGSDPSAAARYASTSRPVDGIWIKLLCLKHCTKPRP